MTESFSRIMGQGWKSMKRKAPCQRLTKSLTQQSGTRLGGTELDRFVDVLLVSLEWNWEGQSVVCRCQHSRRGQLPLMLGVLTRLRTAFASALDLPRLAKIDSNWNAPSITGGCYIAQIAIAKQCKSKGQLYRCWQKQILVARWLSGMSCHEHEHPNAENQVAEPGCRFMVGDATALYACFHAPWQTPATLHQTSSKNMCGRVSVCVLAPMFLRDVRRSWIRGVLCFYLISTTHFPPLFHSERDLKEDAKKHATKPTVTDANYKATRLGCCLGFFCPWHLLDTCSLFWCPSN